MKGSDYFPISKFSVENYANLYRCPAPPAGKASTKSVGSERNPAFMRKSRQPRAQRQRKEGPDSAGRQRRSCRRVTGASTARELWHRMQRSTGRCGPANIRQQATVRETLNRLSDNSSPTGKKNEKKSRQDTDGRQLMVPMGKVRKRTDRKRPG